MGILTPSAGDVDYDTFGIEYANRRQTEPSIAVLVHQALGSARNVLNVGAGAGSYEPPHCRVVAVEPSSAMIEQRSRQLGPVIQAVAGSLPLADDSVDASMAAVTIHQWPDPMVGLAEMRRVTGGPVVVLTFDPATVPDLWLTEYVPELLSVEAARYPSIEAIAEALGTATSVVPVPIPFDCLDGFTEAFYGRPEAFLDPAVRRSQSAWSFLEPETTARFVDHLAADLESGAWDQRRDVALRTQSHYQGAVRLVVSAQA